MLPLLIAAGIIATGGAGVDPGTGDVSAPAGQTASARPNTAGSGTGTGIPTTALAWTQPLDPSDRNFFAQDWSPILGTETIVNIVSITMSAAGAATGVEVDTDPDRVPIIDTLGQKIGIWFKVDDAFKTNAAFAGTGLKVGIAVLVETSATPSKFLERTWVLTVAQQ